MGAESAATLVPADVFAALGAACGQKPRAHWDTPWEDHVAWKLEGKIFCILTPGEARMTVVSTLDKQSALIQHPNISVAPYVGRFGWVAVEIPDQDTLDLAIDLIDESYELVRMKLPKSKR